MEIEELLLPIQHSQLLVMHTWRYEIPQEKRNIIIANALNHCTNDKRFYVVGYLITNRRVFLIGSSETTSFKEVLDYFYYHVDIGILEYKKEIDKYENHGFSNPKPLKKLFTKYPFYNEHIKSLITGKKVTSIYYDPQLARLKNLIHNSNYCSALDYAGGKSPVIVTVKQEIL